MRGLRWGPPTSGTAVSWPVLRMGEAFLVVEATEFSWISTRCWHFISCITYVISIDVWAIRILDFICQFMLGLGSDPAINSLSHRHSLNILEMKTVNLHLVISIYKKTRRKKLIQSSLSLNQCQLEKKIKMTYKKRQKTSY